jgi:hypothetical protein
MHAFRRGSSAPTGSRRIFWPLAGAMTATGELLRSFHGEGVTSQRKLFAIAEAALEACVAATADRDPDEGTVAASELNLLSLHRIRRSAQAS